MNLLQQLWRYRSYIRGGIGRDFSLRYKGSVLGASLVFLVPAFQISLYLLVFGNLLKGRLPGNASLHGYSIYLCTGILFWNFFTDVLQRSQTLFLDNANLLKKAAFPSSSLSMINLASASIHLGLALTILLLFLLSTSALPGWRGIGLLPVWLLMAALALSLGLCLAILQVFFRDIGALTTLGLQALFWATPIVYPASILPTWLVPWLLLNPLLAPVSAAQALLLSTDLPPLHTWGSTCLTTALAALLAVRLYRRHRADLLDHL
ncbi:MAG: ABC transporter permease [Rhodoferax sp.]|nr:ABC transporter permease [Rhodoferax sp.]MCF8212236.1 ABC transporter permease [Rhodoferax sp.]